MPRTVPVIVTAPDGTELWFPSGTAAGEYMGIRMGQLMEVSEEHD